MNRQLKFARDRAGRLCLILLLCALPAAKGDDRADELPRLPAVSADESGPAGAETGLLPAIAPLPAVPERLQHLPHYRMQIQLFPEQHRVSVRQTVTWTNPGRVPVDQLVFQVVPNNKLTAEQIAVGERTVESLRLETEHSIDYRGRRFHLTSAVSGSQPVQCSFSSQHDTHLIAQLPAPVAPGDQVTVTLDYWVDIPQIMGRLGQHKQVTNLLNWYPVLCVYRNDQWEPVPYVPWHQPWYNEAGNYDVSLTLPAGYMTVTGGHVVSTGTSEDGMQTLQIRGEGLRDFTIVTSRRFHELHGRAGDVPIRVQYLPGHESMARVALRTAEETIALYSQWFGPYPYREFELTESFFGWNGNESSGVVMIDSRIIALPDYAHRYVEHLVSHEICHQWWYSAVGTNGYLEPWMDEGLVTWLTRVRMEDKYGPNASVLDLPGYKAVQFPNVQYNNLVHGGYNLFRKRGGRGAPLQSLDQIGNLHNLLFLVYDRGARVTGMIQRRLGRDQFFRFLQTVYQRYQFRILRVSDFQRELEEFSGQSWDEFFEKWLKSDKATDWELADVTVSETESGFLTQARIVQSGEVSEPADVAIETEGSPGPVRIATLSEAARTPPGVTLQKQSDSDWLVTIVSQQKPAQIAVDPDGLILDDCPQNNTWKSETTCRVTPFYTPIDEAPLMTPWNEQAVVAGFGVDGAGRIGFRSSLISGNSYRISPFLAYTAATAARNADYISAGVDAAILNWPSPNWELRLLYEYALLSTVANDPGQQGRIAIRRVLGYTTSVIYPNLSYIDFYTRFGDNFFPDTDDTINVNPAVQQYNTVRAFGVDYHLDTQLPYWDPDKGIRLDATYEHGFHAFGGGASYDRVNGQLGMVQRLHGAPGWLGRTKLAGRIAGGYGWDDNGEHFRFGGPGRFRGRTATDTEGNAFWLTTLEWRFPITGELNYEVLDNTASVNRIDGAVFYDVGRSYLMGDPQGKTDHAVGVGLYFKIPLLSFVENLTVRSEYGYSVTNSTGAFWFGLYRAF